MALASPLGGAMEERIVVVMLQALRPSLEAARLRGRLPDASFERPRPGMAGVAKLRAQAGVVIGFAALAAAMLGLMVLKLVFYAWGNDHVSAATQVVRALGL